MSTIISNKQLAGLCALVILGFSALHAWLSPPWIVLGQFGDTATEALGIWAVAPCALAALALLVGDADLTSHRASPISHTQSALAAALLPLMVLAAIAALREPLSYAPTGWISELVGPALFVGGGLGLCALFWQAVVQVRMPDHWPGALRAILTAGMAAVIWLPFVLSDAAGPGDFAIWVDLLLLSATAAILHELGMTSGVVVALIIFAGAAATFIHAPLII